MARAASRIYIKMLKRITAEERVWVRRGNRRPAQECKGMLNLSVDASGEEN